MNSFQTLVLGIFGFFIIAGLLVIATVKSSGTEEKAVVSMWGVRPGDEVGTLLEAFFEDSETLAVTYQEISESIIDEQLVEALAAGRGPDMVLLPAELLLRYRDKITLIPYANYTERQFRDTFIQVGDLFLRQDGIAALPFSLDPLIMYYNRDFLDEANIATTPKYWDEFLSLANKISLKDRLGNVSKSAVALGEFRNVSHAKEILSALFLQSGNAIFGYDASGGFRAFLDNQTSVSVLDFYTEFANPLKPVYSWNRSLPNSKSSFLASKLAVYFGFGSEYKEIRSGNPNLNFDVAPFPRPRNASVGITYGKLTGISILRTSRNPSASLQAALILTSPQASIYLRDKNGLPPVQRALLSDRPTDAFGAVVYDSATRARAFLDPDPKVTSEAFRIMVESVTSGKSRSDGAIGTASDTIESGLR